MNGDAELPHRSSSPLKRRASSMDPEIDAAKGDVEMTATQLTDTRVTQFRAMSVDAPDPEVGPAEQPPPLMEQIKIIQTLLEAFRVAPIKDGDIVYIVSHTWVGKALALKSDVKHATPNGTELHLGPVDNSDIIQTIFEQPDGTLFTRLKPDLGLESFELFPDDAWKLVMEWYGLKAGQQPIVRHAVNTGFSDHEDNIMYEFHPPVFHIHRLWSQSSPLPLEQSLKATDPPPLVVSRSRTAHAQGFLKDLKNWSGIPLERKIRIFEVPVLPTFSVKSSASHPAPTPLDSPGNEAGQQPQSATWEHLLLDVVTFSEVRDTKRKVNLDDQTGNEKYNGRSSLQFYDLVADKVLVLDEAIDSDWVSTYSSQSRKADRSIPSRTHGSALSSKANSTRSSPVHEGVMTRGRAQGRKFGRSLGAVGLHNLGNTCYMNSALQCIRSVEELTKFFLTDAYVEEVNKINVLGYNGKVAMAYGNLLKEIYNEGRSAVTPRDFKSTVGRCRSTFSGWGQQDSQEFLGFLLDALQEDLSRVRKKPYIEKPDSTDDMINNPDAIREMAEKVWDITRKRDDSVIADLFTGMYKSTLKCPECGKISITFDPFNNLTLPLPMENMWTKTLKFFPLNDVPVKIEVELPKHSSIEALKQFIAIRTGVPVRRLMGAEEFKDRFFKIYDNAQDISEEIQSSDTPTFHELEAVPTNWPSKGPKKKYRSMLDIDAPPDTEWDDHRYETMVIPVFHRRPSSTGRGSEGTSPPHFITLTRQEACSYDMIQRKILQRIATFTTWDKLKVLNKGELPQTSEAWNACATALELDSPADYKVAARSVDGEEDMVDVTTKGARGTYGTAPIMEPKMLKSFNSQPPSFLAPNSFLSPELQNLFDLCYFSSEADGAVPTGWSHVDAHRVFPKLADRIRETPDNDDECDGQSPESWSNTPTDDDDSSNEDDAREKSSITRMADELSDENTFRHNRTHQKPSTNGRKKFKSHRTYGKRGNKRRDKQLRVKHAHRPPEVMPQPTPPAIADGGPLIRLHEGIVVDWNTGAWDEVFDQSGVEHDGRTFIELETLNDPALKINQRRRKSRHSKGITLDECLDEFERAEILSEQDMWYCPRCKEHRRASKKFDLWKTPDYLVAHLKRFSSSGWRRDKLDVLVDFPIEGLDLTSRVIQKEHGKQEVYDLVAVDDHYGGLGGGHYTAYAKNFVNGRWYSYNDSSVSIVSDPSSVVTTAAYLLFYRRRSQNPLGGERFTRILETYEKESAEEDNEVDVRASGDDEDFNTARSRGNLGSNSDVNDDSDGELPSYGVSGRGTIQRSIEDEGIEMSNSYDTDTRKSLDMTQAWSFQGLDGNGADNSIIADGASDEAQFDSSGDDGVDASQRHFEADIVMLSESEMNRSLEGGTKSTGVISVPAEAVAGEELDGVAEIHVDGDRSRSE